MRTHDGGTHASVLKVCITILASCVHGELEGITYDTRFNVMGEVGLVLTGIQPRVEGCKLSPEKFVSTSHFYMMKCRRSVSTVKFKPLGTNVYTLLPGDKAPSLSKAGSTFEIKVPMPKTPLLIYLYSCPHPVGKKHKVTDAAMVDLACTKYTLDLFRVGDDRASLSYLGATGVDLMPFTPTFDGGNLVNRRYHTKVESGQKFSISASAAAKGSVVGIEFLGSGDGGLGPFNGCEMGDKKSMIWHLAPSNATGEFKYKICARAADDSSALDYTMSVERTAVYSARLEDISVPSKYELTKTSMQAWKVIVPMELGSIPISVTSVDPEALIHISFAGEGKDAEKGETKGTRGHSKLDIKMPDNDHLKEGETPQWTQTVEINITASDKSSSLSYLVDVMQNVSSYSMAAGLHVDPATPCELTPKFHPAIIFYTCKWWWESRYKYVDGVLVYQAYEKDFVLEENRVGKISITLDKSHGACKDCSILAPDPKDDPKKHLSYSPHTADRGTFKDGDYWSRKFKYGEVHFVPFQVVAADKFNSTIYWVEMVRECPVWMSTYTTRKISTYATRTAFVMGVSSIANIMALVKQTQFMALTVEIDGVPKVYKNFVHSLKAFNLNDFNYIPWDKLGIPTWKEIERKKHKFLNSMKSQFGFQHVTLLLQYCEARTRYPDMRIYGNALLEHFKHDAKELIEGMSKEVKKKPKKATATDKPGDDADHKVKSPPKKAESGNEAANKGEDKAVSRRLLDFLAPPDSLDKISVDTRASFQMLEFLGKPLSLVRTLQSVMLNETESETLLLLNASFFEDIYDVDLDEDLDANTELGFDHVRRLYQGQPAELSKKLDLSHDDFSNLAKHVMKKNGWTKQQLLDAWDESDINCEDERIISAEYLLGQFHGFVKVKLLLSSTAGTFVLLTMGIVFAGVGYLLLFICCMAGRQRRLKVFEPTPLIILICDAALLPFAKAASKVLAQPKSIMVPFIFYAIQKPVVKYLAIGAFISYPLMFSGSLTYQIRRLISKHFIVWNKKLEKYTDPKCLNMKVILPPSWLPGGVPIIPALLTRHVRACIPILTDEGEAMDFERSDEQKKKDDIEKTGDPTQIEKIYEEDVLAELEDLKTSNQDDAIVRHRRAELIRDQNQMLADRERLQQHRDRLRRVTMKPSEMAKIEVPFEEPIWFPKAWKFQPDPEDKDKFTNTREPGQKEDLTFQMRADDDSEDRPRGIFRRKTIVDIVGSRTQSRKQRSDLERLDAEEKFAMMQWLDQEIRAEKKLLKYGIMQVVAKDGHLCPKELLNPLAEGVEPTDVQLGGIRRDVMPSDDITDVQSVDDLEKANPYLRPIHTYSIKPKSENYDPKVKYNYETNYDPNLDYGFADKIWNYPVIPDKKTSEIDISAAVAEDRRYIENEIGERLIYKGNDGWSKWDTKVILPLIVLFVVAGACCGATFYGFSTGVWPPTKPHLHWHIALPSIAGAFVIMALISIFGGFGGAGVQWTTGILAIIFSAGAFYAWKYDAWPPNPTINWGLMMGALSVLSLLGFIANLVVFCFVGAKDHGSHFLRILNAPGGAHGGECKWMKEPTEGWDSFIKEEQLGTKELLRQEAETTQTDEEKAMAEFGSKKKKRTIKPSKPTMHYADKWQWLYYNELQPWHDDEEADGTISLCGFKIRRADIVFWSTFYRFKIRYYKDRVPFRCTGKEKVEMRKWMWEQLREKTLLKLTVCYMANRHPMYYRAPKRLVPVPGVAEKVGELPPEDHLQWMVSECKFADAWIDVRTRGPEIDKAEGREKPVNEFLEYTIMKIEDTIAFGEREPWMSAVDPPGEGETRIQLDTSTFWRTREDPILRQIVKESPMVPKKGYFTCKDFVFFPNQNVGVKRFSLRKPDGHHAKITLDVKMKHIIPLMRYTLAFKMNVKTTNLDMPWKDSYDLIIGKSKYGEEMNYVIDRAIILLSVLFFACFSGKGGMLLCLGFFIFKWLAWLQAMNLTYKAKRYDETLEAQAAKAEGETFVRKSAYAVFKASFEGTDNLILFMQNITLCLLLLGQMKFESVPGPIIALFCILVCCATLIFMNVSTFGNQISTVAESISSTVSSTQQALVTNYNRVTRFLNGENPLGYQFVAFEESKTSFESTAESVSFVVPDLGVVFEGAPDISLTAPPEDIRAASLYKKLVPFVMELKDTNDPRMKSAKEHYRYDGDISEKLFISLDIEQLMLRKPLPQVMATIQCVNHTGSDLCKPQYDSFLTLFKRLPNDDRSWNPEWDYDTKMTDKLLEGWNASIDHWLRRDLGAVESEKTGTEQIKVNLGGTLKNECIRSNERALYELYIQSVTITPFGSRQRTDLRGKRGYARVLFGTEKITAHFPADRMTAFGEFKPHNIAGIGKEPHWAFTIDIKSKVLVALPVGVTQVKIVIMVQINKPEPIGCLARIWGADEEEATEEVVAFSDDIDISYLAHGQTPTDTDNRLYCKWNLTGSDILPYGGFYMNKADKKKKEDMKKYAESKMSTGDYMRAKLKEFFKGFLLLLSTKSFGQVSENEMRQYLGQIKVVGCRFGRDQIRRDAGVVEELSDLVAGDVAMNLEKIERHKDQWLTFARFFGVTANEQDLDEMRLWLESMEDLDRSFSNSGEGKKFKEQLTALNEKMKALAGPLLKSITRCVTMSTGGESVQLAEDLLLAQAEENRVNDMINDDDDDDADDLKCPVDQEEVQKQAEQFQKECARIAAEQKLDTEDDKDRMAQTNAKLMRRQLRDPDVLHSAIVRLKNDIAELDPHSNKASTSFRSASASTFKSAMSMVGLGTDKSDKSEDNEPEIAKQLRPFEIRKIKISGSVRSTAGYDEELATQAPGSGILGPQLLKKLQEYQEVSANQSNSILHYVIMSEMLKPSKMWRPDSIMPHMAQVMTRELPDLEAVMLILPLKSNEQASPRLGLSLLGGISGHDKKDEILFIREEEEGIAQLVNGHLAFKSSQMARIQLMTGQILKWVVEDPEIPEQAHANLEVVFEPETNHKEIEEDNYYMYLYWDGFRRWVISPTRGEPVPYQVDQGGHERKSYLWVEDQAVTPDKIAQHWHVWENAKNAYAVDSKIYFLKKNSEALGALASLRSNTCMSSAGTLITELWNMVTGSAAADMAMRDCLVSLNSEYIQFAWKDDLIERLAPFRKFLLGEFGSYNRAWFHMTRYKSFSKESGTRNLSEMFSTSMAAIKKEMNEIPVGDHVKAGRMYDLGAHGETVPLDQTKNCQGTMQTKLHGGEYRLSWDDGLQKDRTRQRDEIRKSSDLYGKGDIVEMRNACQPAKPTSIRNILSAPHSNIKVSAGGEEGAIFLSTKEDNATVGPGGVPVKKAPELVKSDDGSGKQRWVVMPDQKNQRLFNIKLKKTLGQVQGCLQTYLKPSDNGTGVETVELDQDATRPTWSICATPAGHLYTIQAWNGENQPQPYLSSDGDAVKLTPTLAAAEPDGSGPQSWIISDWSLVCWERGKVTSTIPLLVDGKHWHEVRSVTVRSTRMDHWTAAFTSKAEEMTRARTSVSLHNLYTDSDEKILWGFEGRRVDPLLETPVLYYDEMCKMLCAMAVEQPTKEACMERWQSLRRPRSEELNFLYNFLEQEPQKEQNKPKKATLRSSHYESSDDLYTSYAASIMDILDNDETGAAGGEVGDGQISVGEIHDLYDKQSKCGDLCEWLQRHEKFCHVHNFWADLSQGLEVELEEFKDSMKHVLSSFVSKRSHVDVNLGDSVYKEDIVTLKSAVWEMPEDVYDSKGNVMKMEQKTKIERKSKNALAQKHRMLKLKFLVMGSDDGHVIEAVRNKNVRGFTLKGFGATAEIEPVQIEISRHVPDLENVESDRPLLVDTRYALSASKCRIRKHEGKEIPIEELNITKFPATMPDGKIPHPEAGQDDPKSADWVDFPGPEEPQGFMQITLLYENVPRDIMLFFRFGRHLAEGVLGKTDTPYFTPVQFRGEDPGAPEVKAKEIFADLDVSMNRMVSLDELIPDSGEGMESVDQTMLKFPVPLGYLAEVFPDPTRKVEGDKMVIRLKVNPTWVKCKEWSELKKALDPTYDKNAHDPNEENVYIQFCMAVDYWNLWNDVITSCHLDQPHEFVRYYDGATCPHDFLGTSQMRHGEGIQKWANGSVYSGSWKHHVYEGEGTLWATADDLRYSRQPIYAGSWIGGVRDGKGTLMWEQDQFDCSAEGRSAYSRRAGMKKMYHGVFKDGLFNGQGTLLLRGADVSTLESAATSQRAGGTEAFTKGLPKLRPPQVMPSEMLRFTGEFKGDYQSVYNEFMEKNLEPVFIANHMDPVEGDYVELDMKDGHKNERPAGLRLEVLKSEDEKYKTPKYLRYFEKDDSEVQHAGLPLPDLGLAFYKLRINGVPADCLHCYNGEATYADGTVYTGYFSGGHPHGDGEIQQTSTVNNRECQAVYSGQWQTGKRHGTGKYQISADGKEQLTYDGDWAFERRQGFGIQKVLNVDLQKASDFGFGYAEYEGFWDGDLRHGTTSPQRDSVASGGSGGSGSKGEEATPAERAASTGFKRIPGRSRLTANTTNLGSTADIAYTYIGDFARGFRQGVGKLFLGTVPLEDEEEATRLGKCIYHGAWQDDLLMADQSNPAWQVCYPSSAFQEVANFKLGPSAASTDPGTASPRPSLAPGLWSKAGCIYLGGFNRYGAKEGWGMLYDPKIMKDPDFEEFFNAKTGLEWMQKKGLDAKDKNKVLPWEEGIEKDEAHMLKLYAGGFQDDLPNGRGIQFLQGDTDGKHGNNQSKNEKSSRTVYEGQFKDGKRNGMGFWHGLDVKGKEWNYQELKGGNANCNNWLNGVMHGVARVETEAMIIDKIMYNEGKSLMQTGTDRVLTAEDPPFDKQAPHGPLKVWPATVVMGERLVTKLCKKNADDGSRVENTPSVLMNILEMTKFKQERRNPDLIQGDQAGAMKVLVRQATDLNTPEEDVWISGGTNDNGVLNGFYYKMSHTFDTPMYRHVAKKEDGTTISKFLYRDIAKLSWMISESPGYSTEKGLRRLTECAMIRSDAKDPLQIRAELAMQNGAVMEWKCWNKVAGEMRLGGTEVQAGKKSDKEAGDLGAPEDEGKKKFSFDLKKHWASFKECVGECKDSSINGLKALVKTPEKGFADRLALRSIVALELYDISLTRGSRASDVEQSKLLLRNPRVYYGRPVYQTEDGSLYLYWQAEDGVPGAGVTQSEIDGPGMVHDLKSAKGGFWCIASAVGLRPEDKGCFACVQEKCVTPDMIKPNMEQGNAPKYTLSGNLIKDSPKNYWLMKDDLLHTLDFTKDEEEALEDRVDDASKDELSRTERALKQMPEDVRTNLEKLPHPVQSRIASAGGLLKFLSGKNALQPEHTKAIQDAQDRLKAKCDGAHKLVRGENLSDIAAREQFIQEQADGLPRQCDYCGPGCRGTGKNPKKIQWFRCDKGCDFDICSACVYKGSQAVCGICSMALIELPFARHSCDAKRHRDCQKVGTSYRCGAGHDWDMCKACYHGTTEVLGTNEEGHPLVPVKDGDDHTCDARLAGCNVKGIKFRCQQTNYEVCEPCGAEKAKEAGAQMPEEKLLGPGMRAVTKVWTKDQVIKTGMSVRVKLGEYQHEDFYIDFEDRFHNIQRWEVQAAKRELVKTHIIDGKEVKDEDPISRYGLYQYMQEEMAEEADRNNENISAEQIEEAVQKGLEERWQSLPISVGYEEVKILHKYQMHEGKIVGMLMPSAEKLRSACWTVDTPDCQLGAIGAPKDFWKFGIDFRIGHNAWVVSMLNDKKELFRYEFKHRIKEVMNIKLHPKDRETELDRFPLLPGSSILAVRWEEVDENKWKASFIPNETMQLRLFSFPDVDVEGADIDVEHLDRGGAGTNNTVHGLDDDEANGLISGLDD